MRGSKVFWQDIEAAAVSVSKQLIDSGKVKDVRFIVGMSRGGFAFAQCLAYALEDNISKKTTLISSGELERKAARLKNKDKKPVFLLADDIIDTGKTFDKVTAKYPHIDFLYSSACIRKNVPNYFLSGKVFSHYVILTNDWVEFPWDRLKKEIKR